MTTLDKVFLLGLDGATFDLLGPWMEAGHLPHLSRLRQEGAWGELESTRPPSTAPAWTTCITGVNPGRHGVFDFREPPRLDPRRPLVSSRSIRAPTLWHIASHHGRDVGVLNVPITYPPVPVNGVLVGGMMTPGPGSDYTYPRELKHELNARGYIIDVEIQKYDAEAEADARRFLDDVAESLERRADALFYLMDRHPWQFYMAVFVALDRIQHLFWKTMADPSSHFYRSQAAPRLRASILSVYQAADALVGRLMDRLQAEGGDLLVVSDHGFGPTRSWLNANRWLQGQGWLRLKPAAAFRKRLFYEAMKVSDSPLVKGGLPDRLERAIRGRIRGGRSAFKTDLDQCIDWPRTRAFFASIPAQGIYINVKGDPDDTHGVVEPGADYELVRDAIALRLRELADPRTGKPIVEQVWRREDVYQGPYVDYAPDLLFVAGDYGVLGRELLGTRAALETSENWANGFHRMNGDRSCGLGAARSAWHPRAGCDDARHRPDRAVCPRPGRARQHGGARLV
jgi:predicted AlkP superfamily phosphohydrolase/phosphomutase